MITSAKNYTKKKKMYRQNPRTNGKSKAIPTKLHKVLRLNFGIIRCVFRYSGDAAYIKLIVEV